MKKSQSSLYVQTRPTSRSARDLISRERSKHMKRSSLASIELSNMFSRPVTARTVLASSRSRPQHQLEVKGLERYQIEKIFRAKCKDLDIVYLKDLEQRFINYCSKSFSNRTIKLNENGLGIESIKVLAGIIKKDNYFCRLNLSKNNLGEAGISFLASALRHNKSIAVLDISSNDLSSEGCSSFFELIKGNESLVSINISSLEGLHRNRLNSKGAEAVCEFLLSNQVLTHLNIADTTLGRDGFEYLIKGVAGNKLLIYLDIGNNGITHLGLESFCGAVLNSNLNELIMSGNKIGNKGFEIIGKMLNGSNNCQCKLNKLDLVNCDATTQGCKFIFLSLENNPNLKHLNLESNDFSQNSGIFISKCLAVNGSLEMLILNNCLLREENTIKICDGMCKNKNVKKLYLCKNFIDDSCCLGIGQMLRKNSTLITLDLSYNSIKNQGGVTIANYLKFNSTLENLLLCDNSLKDEAGRLFADISRYKINLLSLDLSMNLINIGHIKDIKENIRRNRFYYRKIFSPLIKEENEKMIEADTKIQKVYIKIQDQAKLRQDYRNNIEQCTVRLNNAKEEERMKLKVIEKDREGLKAQSQTLSNDLDTLLSENYRIKFLIEKESREISNSTAFAIQECKSLERLSNFYLEAQTKEKLGLKRAELNNVRAELTAEQKLAELMYNSAMGSLQYMKNKIITMNMQIKAIKGPSRKNEELLKKPLKKKKVRRSESQKSIRKLKKINQ